MFCLTVFMGMFCSIFWGVAVTPNRSRSQILKYRWIELVQCKHIFSRWLPYKNQWYQCKQRQFVGNPAAVRPWSRGWPRTALASTRSASTPRCAAWSARAAGERCCSWWKPWRRRDLGMVPFGSKVASHSYGNDGSGCKWNMFHL